MSGVDLADIGKRWQGRITASPEYTVVPNDNIFKLGLYRSGIQESVFHRHQDLLFSLCQEYDGSSLEESFPGEIYLNREGEYYCIPATHTSPTWPCSPSDIYRLYRRDLSLAKGIGPVLSQRLRSRGCISLADLAHSRRYNAVASDILKILMKNPSDIYRFLTLRKGPSHPLTLLSSCLYPPGSYRFVDIETLGLFGRPVILIGLGFIEQGIFQVRQFLLRNIGEEAAVLTAFRECIPDDGVFVSFNGKSFDIPYLSDRLAYYGLPPLPAIPHYDLLHPSRRLWRHVLKDCRLLTLEKRYLQVFRGEDLPGALVPEWYARYMETKNPGPLTAIVAHNRQDVLSLGVLLSHLQQEWYERIRIS